MDYTIDIIPLKSFQILTDFLTIPHTQVTQEIANILEPKGYSLTCRGTIPVKGKGEMVTYFLEDKPSGGLNTS